MKIAVIGAGAVGCYYGGMLARQGCDVTLIGRPNHVAAVQQRGLRLQTATFDDYIPVQASTLVSDVRGANLVLCCVKSADTATAAQEMVPHLAKEARILSLQNGIDNTSTLRQYLANPIAPVVVYVAAGMGDPGHVIHHGRGELVLPPNILTPEEATAFSQAGIPLEISDNVEGALWFKLIINCAFNALSALSGQAYGTFWPKPGVRETMATLVNECLAVAKAEGITLPADPWPSIEAIAQTMPGQHSSTAQDLARGKPTEIDYLNGAIVRRAQAHGLSAPANLVMHTLVKLAEARPQN